MRIRNYVPVGTMVFRRDTRARTASRFPVLRGPPIRQVHMRVAVVDKCTATAHAPAGVHRGAIKRAHVCARTIAGTWTPAGPHEYFPQASTREAVGEKVSCAYARDLAPPRRHTGERLYGHTMCAHNVRTQLCAHHARTYCAHTRQGLPSEAKAGRGRAGKRQEGRENRMRTGGTFPTAEAVGSPRTPLITSDRHGPRSPSILQGSERKTEHRKNRV